MNRAPKLFWLRDCFEWLDYLFLVPQSNRIVYLLGVDRDLPLKQYAFQFGTTTFWVSVLWSEIVADCGSFIWVSVLLSQIFLDYSCPGCPVNFGNRTRDHWIPRSFPTPWAKKLITYGDRIRKRPYPSFTAWVRSLHIPHPPSILWTEHRNCSDCEIASND